MKKLVFNSANKICVYENGKITEYPCDFYENYVRNSIRQAEQEAWKRTGFGAQFRGDAVANLQNEQANETILSEITSINLTGENTINYSIFINSLSAIYVKNLVEKKDSESHVIHDNNVIFKGSEELNNKIVMTASNDGITSHLAIFDKKSDDYCLITDGDSFDGMPTFSKINSEVLLFSSKGVGRDGNGNFVKYSPSYLNSINLKTGDIQEINLDNDYSYVNPKDDINGNLYAIRRPIKEKRKGNLFLDILLVPFRFFYFIYMYFDTMSKSFTGKGLTGKNNNPAKVSGKSNREIFIDGNVIHADKEYQNNLKHKDDFAGIIPRSYELIKILPDGTTEIVKKGIIAYTVDNDGTIYASNGKYILKINDGKTEKLCEANLATTISIY